MKDGYYLSAYVHIDELACLEKIQVRHDQNIALWSLDKKVIKLIHYWELERLTGIKRHNYSFYNCTHFEQILNQLLDKYNITKNDIIDIWGVPQYASDRVPLGKNKGFSYHATAHVYSVLLSNTDIFRKNNILVLAVDGGPDNLFDEEGDIPFCACYTSYGKIINWTPISSPAPLWSYAKNAFSLQEGSLMALVSACKCEYSDFFIPFFKVNDLHSAYRAARYLEYIKKMVFSIQFDKETQIKYDYDSRFTEEENKISMFMKIIVRISNQIMCNNLDILIKDLNIEPNDTYLAVVGGYALNCPSNTYLLNKYQFKAFYEVPCVNDSGMALGYGLGEFFAREKDINFKLNDAFYGNSIEYDEKVQAEVADYIENVCEASPVVFAEDISKEVVIWIEGRSEIGPRALGHRSILADPRGIKAKSILNRIKGRQWWRPVAPIVLQENVVEWFIEGTVSEYMLKTFMAIDKVEEEINAVLHLDKSARVQTINKEQGFLYECISAFYASSGIPMVCNTSLNDKGEPIIDTLYGALLFALEKDIRIIYINHVRVVLNKRVQRTTLAGKDRKIDFEKYKSIISKDEVIRKLNPYNVSGKALKIYYDNKKLYNGISLTDKKSVKLLEKLEKLNDIYQMGESY